MATSVTYDGVPSAEGGNIFRNMSFWVAQRVPLRKHFVDLIEHNGGKVVPLEKNAEMLIADCGRPKNAPVGSYSWKFIEDSVKNGIAQLHDRYRIGPDPDLPRPAASGGVTKTTRTAFTSADDAAIVQWVLSHPVDRTGNKIFQEFEAMNPRHTWQSWRNRYVKTLALLPMDRLEKLAAMASTEEPRHEIQNHETTQTLPLERKCVRPAGKQANTKILSKRSEAVEGNQRHSITDKEPENASKETREPPQSISPEHQGDDVQVMSQFQQDFTEFMQLQGQEVQLEVRIGPSSVKLWDLLQAAGGQNVPPEEIDWIKVAEELGYTWGQSRKMVTQLRDCYERTVLPFLDAMDDYYSDDEGNEGDVHDSIEVGQTITVAPSLLKPRSPSYVPSSPPAEFTRGKRPFEAQSGPPSVNQRKRRRLSQEVEIPSTPEEELKGNTKNNLLRQSPSLRRSLLLQSKIPDSEASQQLPPLPGTKPRTAEPETQDYHIQATQPTSGSLERQDTLDVTPSQQLRSEDLDATAIPFEVEPGRRDQRTSSDEPEPPSEQQQTLPKGPGSALNAPVSLGFASRSTSAPSKSAKASKRSLPASFTSSSAWNPSTATDATRNKATVKNATNHSTEKSSNLDEISRWVEHYEALGYSNRVVVEALKRTTMIPGGLAGIVMQSLQEGKGIPQNHEGIWEDKDDRRLRLAMSLDLDAEPQDAQQAQQLKRAKEAYRRVLQKHGGAKVQLRKQFLEADTSSGGGGRGVIHG
ncbi:Telomeric repeat-binding factor 2-interacting protein [Paramyrothecium foliicola]|nr:Telomeric repeat-binding factor 2-interacting protein [Paramyrothecium foliicola]